MLLALVLILQIRTAGNVSLQTPKTPTPFLHKLASLPWIAEYWPGAPPDTIVPCFPTSVTIDGVTKPLEACSTPRGVQEWLDSTPGALEWLTARGGARP